jgi:hypothetical protein
LLGVPLLDVVLPCEHGDQGGHHHEDDDEQGPGPTPPGHPLA